MPNFGLNIHNSALFIFKSVLFWLIIHIRCCYFYNFHLFCKPNQLIIDTKFAILRFYFMVPSENLVLVAGAIFRGNTVLP